MRAVHSDNNVGHYKLVYCVELINILQYTFLCLMLSVIFYKLSYTITVSAFIGRTERLEPLLLVVQK